VIASQPVTPRTVSWTKLGAWAEPRIRKRLEEQPSLECRERLESLLDRIEDQSALPITRQLTTAVPSSVELFRRFPRRCRALIDDLDPRWILLVGIAGGFADDNYSPGDVLLASRIYHLSVSAVLLDRSTPT
jgi:hypothetical protein